MEQIIWVGLGGLCGAVARYSLGKALTDWVAWQPHVATLAINVIGSLVLGFASARLAAAGDLQGPSRLFLAVGFCGAFTTFSSWISDITLLAQRETMRQALLHVLISLGCGLVAFGGGFLFGERGGGS